MKGPNLSLAMPAFNEASHLEKTVGELVAALDKDGVFYEIIVVDNGSTDDTSTVGERLTGKYPTVKIVTIKPNAGYGGGILAGLSQATGNILG